MVPIQLASAALAGPFIARAIHKESPWSETEGQAIGARVSLLVGAGVALVWFSLRDTLPGLSWGKWLLGLRVTRAGAHAPASLWRRWLRNLLFAIPFFNFLEGVVALVPWSRGRRAGLRRRLMLLAPGRPSAWGQRE